MIDWLLLRNAVTAAATTAAPSLVFTLSFIFHLVCSFLALIVILVSSRNFLPEGEDTQKIYDELPFNDEIFNLSERNLEMYDKLGKVLV